MKYAFLSILVMTSIAAAPYRHSVRRAPIVYNTTAVVGKANQPPALEFNGHQVVANEINATNLFIGGAVTTLGAAWMSWVTKKEIFDHNSHLDYALNGMVGYVLPITVMTHGVMYCLQAMGVDVIKPLQATIGGVHIIAGFGSWAVLTAGYFFNKEPGKIIGTFLTAAPFVALGAYDVHSADGSLLSIRF